MLFDIFSDQFLYVIGHFYFLAEMSVNFVIGGIENKNENENEIEIFE